MKYRWPKAIKGKENRIWFGGDYNPEQWSEEIWEEDIRLMKKAKVNVVTLGVFAWALLEPEDGVYKFEWLDQIVNKLYKAGIAVDMATATATPPRWLTSKYPEILPRNNQNAVIWPGGRQHWRPTSKVFRRYALRLTEHMAEHFKNNPAVVAWHVSNELGCHNRFDYSDDAAAGFREWLKKRYGSLEELNRAWNGAFWSQIVTDWEQIIPPRECLGGINPTTMLDFKRFSSDALLEYYQAEEEILHRITPDIPVTTNLMVLENQVNPVDCMKWGRHMDFVSNDHYYLPDERHLDEMVMSAAIVSGAAHKNSWFLMENSTSSVNWRRINLRKQPGEIIRDAMVHVANGADGICFFQWRQSQAGAEKFHSSMLPHAGENSKVFREVCSLGEALEMIKPVLGSRVKQSKVAMIYDYDSWWAYENGLLTQLFDYRSEFYHWYRAMLDVGVVADVVGIEDDWEKYETVMFPVTFLVDSSITGRTEKYVRNGGHLVVTYGSGISDSCDHVYLGGYPGAFKDILGIRVEEFSAIDENHKIMLSNGWSGSIWADDITEITNDCQVIAYIDDTAEDKSLRGQPIITNRKVEAGQALYIGTKLDRKSAAELISQYILGEEKRELSTSMLLRIQRIANNICYEFVFNRSKEETIEVSFIGDCLYLSYGTKIEQKVLLEPSGVVIFAFSQLE
ncbi:MAG: beta-galactosidase [Muricoprocola sp.]